MSVIVKGMDMPEKCNYCPLVYYYEDLETGNLDVWCKDTHKLLAFDWEGAYIDRPDWCPISDVSVPHGRLIDANALKRKIYEMNWETKYYPDKFMDEIIHLPTIIEAEK